MNILKFASLRYLNYALLLTRGIILSISLSYQEYASWGIVMFVVSYHTIIGFGIPKVILIKLKEKKAENFYAELAGTSVSFILLLCFIFSFIKCVSLFIFI